MDEADPQGVGQSAQAAPIVNAETEWRLSAQRFRTLAEATSNTLYRMNATGTDLVELHGGQLSEHRRELLPSQSWLVDYVHPEDQAEMMKAWNHAMSTGTPFESEIRVKREDGEWRWMLSHCVPVRDEHGTILEWIGCARDIDERKRSEMALVADVSTLLRDQSHQRLLVAELQHRTRNLLSVVRVIASQTFGRQDNEAPLSSFLDRLGSLSRVQGLLSRGDRERVNLADVVHAELEPYNNLHRSRIEVHGPDVRLSYQQVQLMALAIHELFTNALKYGALKEPTGQLSITWESWSAGNGKPRLAITWKESGVVMPAGEPLRRGQGRELIENALRFSLRAETQLVFRPSGVWCRIELPLETTHPDALDPGRAFLRG